MAKARCLLGRPYEVKGRIIGGKAGGSELALLNFDISPQNELLPRNGVYAVRVEVGRQIYSGTVSGGASSASEGSSPLELLLIGKEVNIGDGSITVFFHERLGEAPGLRPAESDT